MLKTEEIRCKVAGTHNNHYWLELLDPREEGMRVSVPIYSQEYEQELEQKIKNWNTGDVLTVVLYSKQESPPQWRVDEIIESDMNNGQDSSDSLGESSPQPSA